MSQTTSKKRFQTKACIAGMKTLLMVFDGAFWVTGLILFIIGIWMKMSLSKFFEISRESNFSLPGMFIVLGAVMMIVSFFACYFTAKGNTRFLYSFATFLVVAFIIVIAGAATGYAYRSSLQRSFKSGLTNAINEYGKRDFLETDIDRMQSVLTCCGVNNYTDWFGTRWANGSDSVPKSCCFDPNKCQNTNLNVDDIKNEIYINGCYDIVIDLLTDKLNHIALAALIIALLQLIGVFLSCCLAKYINTALYEEMK